VDRKHRKFTKIEGKYLDRLKKFEGAEEEKDLEGFKYKFLK